MKLISWNTANRHRRADEQVAELLAKKPDIVALQEVTHRAAEKLIPLLEKGGLKHTAFSHDYVKPSTDSRKARVKAPSIAMTCGFPSLLILCHLIDP